MRGMLCALLACLVAPSSAGWSTVYSASEGEDLQRSACLPDGLHVWTVCRRDDVLLLLRSTNGWRTHTSYPLLTIPHHFVLDMQFVDEHTGWLTANGPHCINRTDNGGAHFEVEDCPTSPLDVAQVGHINMMDARHGWALITETEHPWEWRRVLLYDGTTRQWKRLHVKLTFQPECMFALDLNHVWVTGSPGEATRYVAPKWGPLRPPGDWLVRDIFFLNSKEGWACGDGGHISHTADGGRTWQPQNTRVPTHVTGGALSRIEAIAFRDSQNGCAVTLDHGVRMTRDGGAHWLDVRGPMWHRIIRQQQFVWQAYPCLDVDAFAKGFYVTSDHGLYGYTSG